MIFLEEMLQMNNFKHSFSMEHMLESYTYLYESIHLEESRNIAVVLTSPRSTISLALLSGYRGATPLPVPSLTGQNLIEFGFPEEKKKVK
jgi:hypothetical protein